MIEVTKNTILFTKINKSIIQLRVNLFGDTGCIISKKNNELLHFPMKFDLLTWEMPIITEGIGCGSNKLTAFPKMSSTKIVS